MKYIKGEACEYCKFDVLNKCFNCFCDGCKLNYCSNGEFKCKCLDIEEGEECPYFERMAE